MNVLRLTLLFGALNFIGSANEPLRVLRATPQTPADPFSDVTITFDRPVAGGLEDTIAASDIFTISPAVDGRVEWRDPVSLRFTPRAPFPAGASYTVTIEPSFRAMDGSSLERPYRFTFRVATPRVIGGIPANANQLALHLPPQPTFSVLVTGAVDPAAFARSATVVVDRACGGRTFSLRATGQRRVAAEDDPYLRYNGLRTREPGDSLDFRRVVDLTTEAALPLDCTGLLVLPENTGDPGEVVRWRFRTHGDFTLQSVTCAVQPACPRGPLRVVFNTPVQGAEVLRHVRIAPDVRFHVSDTLRASAEWLLDAQLAPRTPYAVVVDSTIKDVFGQRFAGVRVRPTRTTGYAPTVTYDYGRTLVERVGLRTLPVQHVNVDSLVVTTVAVPDSMEDDFLSRSWNWDEPWAALRRTAVRRVVPVRGGPDEQRFTGVRLPLSGQPFGAVRSPTLFAVQVSSTQLDSASRRSRPLTLVQVTDLAVHARIGHDQGMVWVTGVSDGRPRPGATVTLHDARGRTRASGRTDAQGLAHLESFRVYPDSITCEEGACDGFEGYVAATLGDDRAVVGLNAWDPDLAPWRFGIWGAWGEQRAPLAAAVFTERDIYRPGETVYAKAIVRHGPLGALAVPRGDSIRWLFRDREDGVLRDTTVALSAFGTSDLTLQLGAGAPLGYYGLQLHARINGEWRPVAYASYQVAEYRPPEFLLDVQAEDRPRFGGDTAQVHLSARYLFGAPMAHAPVRWALRIAPRSWGVAIPGAEDYQVGGSSYWDEDAGDIEVAAEGADSLDALGQLDLAVLLPAAASGRAATATLQALVTDANRQSVAASTSITVHPAAFYIGVRPRGDTWFWTAGRPVSIDVITLSPDGERVLGVDVTGVVVRREWHRIRRTRNGQVQEIGAWVSDTVATCPARTAAEPVPCSFTPPGGGSYTVTFRAVDPAGRAAMTALSRWASGDDWVPWNDDSQLKMDVVPDRQRYTVGDTATILFASPFTDAEAWITVERERVLDSRRIRINSGATTLRLPITEAYAPNAFVSIVVVRGRSAAPGPLDDPGRPTMRVGYAELRITPEVKRLAVEVTPLARALSAPINSSREQSAIAPTNSSRERSATAPINSSREQVSSAEYRPGDTASIRIRVRDASGTAQRAEVTIWAVDEGVLALTGYRTPDPLELIYAARGLGVRLASNLVAVAPQIPDGEKGRREPGGGGGGDLAGVLRSRFQTTAFFLASVHTDANGEAVARAKLPDNLTTFRVMAVAVTAGDRYGSGEASLLVTRPLIARPALPRFVRPGDRFSAGTVVNHRLGGTPRVDVEATASGLAVEGGRRKRETLSAGRGTDVRFDFRVPQTADARRGAGVGDSVRFQFSARSEHEADAVEVRVPVRPDYHPLARTIAGVLRDTAVAEFVLEGEVDASRSQLTISFGTSPLAIISGARRDLQVYPYYCTEQLSSIALPLIALYRAQRDLGGEWLRGDPEGEIREVVALLARRQNPDGGFGYWSATHWGTPGLSAYVGRVLLEARSAGISVDSVMLPSLADHLFRSLHEEWDARVAVSWWYADQSALLSERVAAADFLSRFGRPDVATENALLANAARLRWEDRVLLAEMLARRGQSASARELLDRALAGVTIAGRGVDLPAEVYASAHYFHSELRPVARLLTAVLAVDASHSMIAPLVETLVQHGRARGASMWNTQDYAHAVLALMQVEAIRRSQGNASVRIRANGRNVLSGTIARNAPRDTTVSLDRLVTRDAQGRHLVRVDLQSTASQAPVFYFLTVREVPKARQLNPIDRGIQVERWYETVDTRRPTMSVAEGELIRVRLRITVPAERHFLVVDDPLPAGLEAVDLSLRTVSPFSFDRELSEDPRDVISSQNRGGWYYGSWDSGVWSPFDHKELRDDRVVYSATVLWPGTYTATYLARATTAGTFIVPPAHAEEMYNPGVNGRTGGGEFRVLRPVR